MLYMKWSLNFPGDASKVVFLERYVHFVVSGRHHLQFFSYLGFECIQLCVNSIKLVLTINEKYIREQ